MLKPVLSVAFAATLVASSPARAEFADYRDVPDVYTINPSRFGALFETAKTDTVRMAIFGDSQETSPGGGGRVYVPRLNYEAATHYGNVPETPFVSGGGYGGGSPPAEWLVRGSAAGGLATRLAPDRILPGVAPLALTTKSGNAYGQSYGQLLQLQHDAANVDAGAAIPTAHYMDPAGTIRLEIFAATNASSGEIGYLARPSDSTTPSYFAATTTTGTLNLGLQSATHAIRSGKTAGLDYAGKQYMAVEVVGTDGNALTDFVGARFVNESNPAGMTFTDFSIGGYRTESFAANHGAAGAMFAATGMHAVILHTGANDSTAKTAAQFRQDQLDTIAMIRLWANDPNLPFILVSDPDRSGLSASARQEFDQYVGAQVSIAAADPNVMVVNARLMMNRLGWSGEGDLTTFTADGVHYTPYGAQLLAEHMFSAMHSVPDPSSISFLAFGAVMLIRRR